MGILDILRWHQFNFWLLLWNYISHWRMIRVVRLRIGNPWKYIGEYHFCYRRNIIRLCPKVFANIHINCESQYIYHNNGFKTKILNCPNSISDADNKREWNVQCIWKNQNKENEKTIIRISFVWFIMFVLRHDLLRIEIRSTLNVKTVTVAAHNASHDFVLFLWMAHTYFLQTSIYKCI